MPSDDEVDPGAPLFFLSYAHSPTGQQTRFIRFFDDLSENVAELVSRPAGADPGYLDQSMSGGSRWTGEILEAIGTCQVFVALLSARYFKSTWCGKEWFAFSQRTVSKRDGTKTGHQSAVIPVIWAAPLPQNRIPAKVQAIQRFSPRDLPNADVAARYETEGVVGLLQTQVDLYHAVVWRLAQRIAHVHYNYDVEPLVLDEGQLLDSFREQGT